MNAKIVELRPQLVRQPESLPPARTPAPPRYVPDPRTCPRCGDDHPFDRRCVVDDDNARAAYAAFARAAAALLNQ